MNTVAKTEGVARKMGIAKKAGIAIGATLAVALVAGYVFRAPLQEAMAAGITADMFVERDTDKFDPGVAVGQVFPALNARLTDRAQSRQVTGISEFMGTRGVVVFVNRSVDW